MPAISRTTNPTGVLPVDSNALSLRVVKGNRATDPKTVFIERFAPQKAGLLPSLRVACIATAGQTSQYFELGSVGAIDLGSKQLTELATDAALRFRVIFYEEHDCRVVAAADNIRALDESQLSQSLVSIQPGALNGPLWKLELSDSKSENLPVVHVEEQMFASAKAAAASAEFVSYVLPEVLRQVAVKVAAEWDDLDREGSWLGKWADFLEGMNPADLDEMEDDMRDGWASECVELFCRRGHMSMSLTAVLMEANGHL